uniref:ARAD1D42482p n=1 Tax=Blastobotrys adeninivorans TaxID=409370 RepID=A0A060TCI0_BLAAD
MQLALLWLWIAVVSAWGQKKSAPPPKPELNRVEISALRTEKPFVNKLSNRHFDFGGDAIIQNDAHIRLTSDRQGQRGWYFAKAPFMTGSFQVELEFRIHGQGGSLYGDGMALWILDKMPKEGPVFGIEDKPRGLGLFVDTYKNERPGRAFPYAMLMLGDGHTPYDADHDGAANELGGCSLRGIHNSDTPTKLRLTHVKDGFLSVESDRGRGWETCFVIDGIRVPTPGHLGVSAQTGELHDNHDIISMKAYQLRTVPNTFEEYDYAMNGREPPKGNFDRKGRTLPDPSEQQSSGWLWFFFKWTVIACILVGGYLGFRVYQVKQKRKQEPFYL